MPGYNLVRNAKAFFTTNLNASKAVATTGHLNTNTFEVQVTNGFTFSQNTETQVITVNEAGATVARSQRTFNTALAPVDFSFSTYIRPKGTTTVNCEERVLWNALLNSNAIDLTGLSVSTVSAFARTASLDTVTFTCTAANLSGASIAEGDVVTVSGITGVDAAEWNMPATFVSATPSLTAATSITLKYLKAPAGAGTAPASAPTTLKLHKGAFVQNVSYSLIHSGGSNKNQLQAFGMIIAIDDVTYTIDNCVLDQATVEFGLDGISMVTWTGKGTKLNSLAQATATAGTFGGALTGSYLPKVTDANYITQKLSTLTLKSTLRGLGTGAASYLIPITGGSLSIANNVTYITPENLGVVNEPVGYFTGTRAITGTLTAYLKSGADKSGGLLSTILTGIATATETKYMVQVEVGGISNATRVEFEMPATMIQVPTIDAQDVISTSIAFTAQGFDGSSSLAATVAAANYDVDQSNDLFVRYYSAV